MKINIVIPASWNELSDSQFKELAKLSYSGKKGNYYDLQCFKILLNSRWYQFSRRMHVKFVLSQISIKTLKKTFDFVYKANDRTIFPKISNGYFSPLDKITNLTAEEFSIADDLHIKWRTTQDKECLFYLAAVLYSKTKQPREPFDKNNLPEKVKHFKKLPFAVLLCIELAYFGCKNHLVKRFPKAFPKAAKKVSNSKYGFGKVILQMAGGKFGNHEQTKSTNIYTFLEEFTENLNTAKNA